jgi:hypothetical protein
MRRSFCALTLDRIVGHGFESINPSVPARERCIVRTSNLGLPARACGMAVVLCAVLSLSASVLRGADCNRNRIEDAADLDSGFSADCNGNGHPDECEFTAPEFGLAGDGLPVRGLPRAVVGTDLNGDGLADVATANATGADSFLSIVLSRGEGMFAPAVHHDAGTGVSAMTFLDFDGDADIDLVTANSDVLWLFENQGDATLNLPIGLTVPRATRFLTAGDVTGDGTPDLVTSNVDNKTVSLLENRGGTNFSAPVPLFAVELPLSLVAADLDGDGDLDLAVGDSESLAVSLNEGNATFAAAVRYASGGERPSSVVAGDLDGNGNVDLAAATASGVSILRNEGAATFSEPVSYLGPAKKLVLDDLDGDGDLDLARVASDSQTVSLLINSSNARFGTAAGLAIGLVPRVIHSGDVDGDGDPDLLVGAEDVNRILVLLGGEVGTPRARAFASTTLAATGRPHAAVMGDVNGDSNLDVITANGHADSVSVWSGNGDGTLATPQDFGVANAGDLNHVTVADLDGDGDLDLATGDVDFTRIQVYLNPGDGTFSSWTDYEASGNPLTVTAGDVNADGHLDLLGANHSASTITLLVNNGDGSFTRGRDLRSRGTGVWGVVAVDLDGDGDADVASANLVSVDISVLLSNGDGTFSRAVTYPILSGAQYLTAGDLDRDGDQDLAGAGSRVVTVLLNDGEGRLAAQENFPVRQSPYALTLADVDGDGLTDVLTANEADHTVSLLVGHGDATFDLPFVYPVGERPRAVVAGDLNHDGEMDFVSANHDTLDITVMINAGPNPERGHAPRCGASHAFRRGDVNVDGVLNLTDSIFLLNYLFLFARDSRPPCLKSGDANDDGALNLVDPIYLLSFLFREGPAPAVPGTVCGEDPTADRLSCEAYPPCA